MSAQHDASRREMARLAGLILMGGGAVVALTSGLAAIVLAGWLVLAAFGHGHDAAFFVVVGGAAAGCVVLALLGVGKALAGWILVRKDQVL